MASSYPCIPSCGDADISGGKWGFQCNDPALSHPFTGDTVSWNLLMIASLTLPLIVLLLVERAQEISEQARQQALKWYKEYTFGFLLNLTFVQFVKFVVGSPRPHFFDTCRPIEAQTCDSSQYVYSYRCTKAHWINQSDTSFPSGHSSLAFHAGFFIAYYLYQRSSPSKRTLTAQVACVSLAAYCAASRLWDHRHHWWDVLAGILIAIVILTYTILHSCGNFECEMTKNEQEIVAGKGDLINSKCKVEENLK